MAKNEPTHEVIHSSLYFRGGEKGELKEVPVGTLLRLNEKQAKGYMKRGMVKPIGDAKPVDMSGADATALEEELATTKTALEAALADLVTARGELDAAKGDLEGARGEIETLKGAQK